MIKTEYIQKLVEEKIADTKLFIVGIDIAPGNIITVLMDGDDGITIKECIDISREIESNLDREEEDFDLEVSSYGISNPLILFRQFEKNIGRSLEIKTKDGIEYEGELISASDNIIKLKYTKYNHNRSKVLEEKQYEINFDDIDQALVQVSFKK
jgi:ribosome maturation factor RimP